MKPSSYLLCASVLGFMAVCLFVGSSLYVDHKRCLCEKKTLKAIEDCEGNATFVPYIVTIRFLFSSYEGPCGGFCDGCE